MDTMVSLESLRPFLKTAIASTDFRNIGTKYTGKVRDVYIQSKKKRRILIATDRQSAFDQLWCTIPLKGQVLTQISAWWFEEVGHIMPTHFIALPDPNVTVVKNLTMIPVEIVVRGYLTGSTKTSAWVNYAKGIRTFCGNTLPNGMIKNQPFDSPIITPTTKSEEDELIEPEGIIERNLATPKQWEEIHQKAIALFRHGQEVAAQKNFILVDTKYEMGIDEEGTLTLADEVHTPDSSRYWIADTYGERFARGEEPQSLDKEFFRLWLRGQGFDPVKPAASLPTVTDDVRLNLAARYIDLFERITGKTFTFPATENILERIKQNLKAYEAPLP